MSVDVERAQRFAYAIVAQLPVDLPAYDAAVVGATVAGMAIGQLARAGAIADGRANDVLDGLRAIIERTAEAVAEG